MLSRQWHYVQRDARDLRIDFLRGFCAFAMVVDHLGGASFLYPLTGGNTFYASAAEGFIFLSGLMVGLINGRRIDRDGLATVQLRLLRRALTLYAVTLGLTFVFVGLSRLAGMPWLQDVEPLTPQLAVSLITLHHTYYLVDVMLLYTLLLAISPLALLLLHARHTRWLVGMSVALWAAHLAFSAQATVPWEIVNNDTFRVSAWQLWFFGGMAIGYHWDAVRARFGRIPRVPALAVLVALAMGLVVLRLIGPTDSTPFFDKHFAAPGRVLAFAVFFPLLYVALTLAWVPLARVAGWLLLPYGQNALYVYAMHLFAIFFAALVLPYVPGFDRGNAVMNGLVQVAAVLGIWLLVKRQVLFDVIPR